MNLKHMNISMGCTQLEEPTNIGKPMSEMANLGDPSLVGLM